MQTLISAEQIQNKITELKETIKRHNYDYIICVLSGAYMFFSDLTKDISSKIDFIKASSYVETHSTGKLDIQFADFDKYRDLNVLLVDDICDTGITLNSLKDLLLRYGAKNVDTCVLLNKKTERKVVMEPTFYAFSIANEFVIGYGLDYNDNYRTLPYIAVL